MTDIVDRATRSRMMASIRDRNTSPELRVRSHLHRAGLRFRLHPKNLPGRPDVVLPRYRAVVFVHGCFWHRHPGCDRAYIPKSNRRFWLSKFAGNVKRDAAKTAALRAADWRVFTVWECRVSEARLDALVRRIRRKPLGDGRR